MLKLLSLSALIVLASACAKKEGGDKPSAPYTEAQSIELSGKLVRVYEDAGMDCNKLLAGLEKFTKENGDAMRAQNAWKAKLTPEEKSALEAKVATQLEIGKKMLPVAQACADHPGVDAAAKSIPLD